MKKQDLIEFSESELELALAQKREARLEQEEAKRRDGLSRLAELTQAVKKLLEEGQRIATETGCMFELDMGMGVANPKFAPSNGYWDATNWQSSDPSCTF